MTLLAVANDDAGPRLGVVVSRKAARTAVARNRVKRQIRESFRQSQTALGSLDIVVIGRAGIATQGNRALARSLETLWIQLIKTCAAC
jgi:ribonuclease P protein component